MAAQVDCCSKYFLFGFNVLFWLIAMFLVGIGIWAWLEKGFFDDVTKVSELPFDPVIVINLIGITMFILTFAGCIGSLRENIFLLKCFSFCLSVIFFAEIIVGMLGFVYKEWFTDQFETFINKTVVDYREDPDLQNIVDFTQGYFKCCGGAGPDDWDNNPYFNCTHTVYVNDAEFSLVESCGVPFSCCVQQEGEGEVTVSTILNTQCGYGVRSDDLTNHELVQKIYTDGCIESFEAWIKTNLYTVGGVLIGLALLQIIPICIAQNVVADISAIKARWSTAGKAGFHNTPYNGRHSAQARSRQRSRQSGPARQSGRSRPGPARHSGPARSSYRLVG